MKPIEGWLVIWAEGPFGRAVFLDHEVAVLFAARKHGTVHSLVRGD